MVIYRAWRRYRGGSPVNVPDSVAESMTSDTDPVLYELRDTGVAVLTL